MIKYNSITLSDTAPIAPNFGDWWIKPLASTSYQVYIYFNIWTPILSGGDYISETDIDTHYINTVIQEDLPTDFIQPGWIWIKESTRHVYIYLNEYIPLIGY